MDGDLDRSVIRAGFGLDPRQVLLLFVGRVDHEKLLDVPIRALARAECAGIQLALSRQRAEAHAWPAVLDRFEGLYAASIASGATGFAVVE